MSIVIKVPENRSVIRSAGPYPSALNMLDPRTTAVQRQLRRTGLAGYEPATQAALLALASRCADGAVFIDVGAHIGLYSALISAVYGSRGPRVFAFEPAPDTANLCRRIRDANGLAFDVVQAAVSSRTGSATLFLSAKAETSNSLNETHRSYHGTVEVPMTTIDAFCREQGLNPGLVKIDVETHEPDVLAGALDTIRDARPWIVCELLNADNVPEKLMVRLEEAGYRYYQLTEELPWREERARSVRLHTGQISRDWLFAPRAVDESLVNSVRGWLTAIAACPDTTNLIVADDATLSRTWNAPYSGPSRAVPPGTMNPTRVPRALDDVPGWLNATDQLLFEWLLTRPSGTGSRGDLLEIGVYHGKSAIQMGRFRRPGEKFTACDLFDLAHDDDSIRPGARTAYATLTQKDFEDNYLAFHDELPIIVRGRSDVIVDHVAAGSCRFVHIDASKTYEHVRGDVESARKLMRADGVVVVSDYRTEHTPGTAAAMWEAMATGGLHVICLSANKFYATWDDPSQIQNDLIEWLAGRTDHRCDLQDAMGQRLPRVVRTAKKARATKPDGGSARALLSQAQETLWLAQDTVAKLQGHRSAKVPTQQAPSQRWRRAAVQLLPPIVTDSIRRSRRRRAAHQG
jgi:FkbM family methyltransferase